MKDSLKQFVNPNNVIAFFIWAFIIALVIYNNH
jgi:hypothetical protein